MVKYIERTEGGMKEVTLFRPKRLCFDSVTGTNMVSCDWLERGHAGD